MKRNKSFIWYCVCYFTLYAFILFLSFVFINLIVNKRLQNITVSLPDLLKYNHFLERDDFNKIPLRRFKRNEIAVFDENNNLIFSTRNHKDFYINSEDLAFISNYYDNSYYHIQEYLNENNEKVYFISKNIYNDGYEFERITDFAELDTKLNILRGTMFGEKKSLTQREFELLQGTFSKKSYLEKYSYETKDKKERTLIFFAPILDNRAYSRATRTIYSLWFMIVPVIILFELFITFLFFRKIKLLIAPIKRTIDNYEKMELEDFNDSEIPKEFLGIFHSFKQLFVKLKDEKEKRANEQRERQDVIANLSHDLKTPLTVIQGYSKAFKDGVVPPEKQVKYMEAIYNKSLATVNIIDSLFEYSQMEHFAFKPNFQISDFSEFCKEYLALKYTDLELQGFKLQFHLYESKVMFRFDPRLITRLLDNIINNSIKYNRKGSTIYFDFFYKNEEIRLVLADNGVGIDPNITDDLFMPFIIGDVARNSGNGTGLGLYIAKSVVLLHNGTIHILKEPKRPHKFAIEICFPVK